jgi:hypothetical protein
MKYEVDKKQHEITVSKNVLAGGVAPVGISTYSRIEHLKNTIKALKNNVLAADTEIYCFSDAPKPGDENAVVEIRRFLHSICGFKEVHVVERLQNNRVLNNRGGMQQLLQKYGKVIWIEEDVETAPGFLSFMNEGLIAYADDPSVVSLTGYCPPIRIPKNYEFDSFPLKRFCAWGFGTWSSKFDPFGFEVDRSVGLEFLKNYAEVKRFVTNGEDMKKMLEMEVERQIDALDVKVMFHQFVNNLYTIYPKKSLVQNNGFDGTGLHCSTTDAFTHKSLWDKTADFKLLRKLELNKEIEEANRNFRKISFRRKMKTAINKTVLTPIASKVMNAFK